MIRLKHNQRGQVTILFTLLLPVIFGLLGLALDIGQVAYNKQRMQNALDLSVLAGAQELVSNPDRAVQKVKDYGELNGLDRVSIKVNTNYKGDPKKIQAELSKVIHLWFAPLLGIQTTTVNVSAAAEVTVTTRTSSAFSYALFSGSPSIGINSSFSGTTFNGDVHCNASIRSSGGNNVFNGILEVVGNNDLKNDTIYNGPVINPSTVIPLPAIDINDYKINATTTYNNNVSFNGGNLILNGIMFVNGDISITGGCKVMGKGSIIATGNITISGTALDIASDGSLIGVYSLKDITLTNQGKTFHGVVYAPNGCISMTGGNDTFIGSVISSTIKMTSGGYTFSYDSRVKECFGGDIGTQFHLIE